MSFQSEFAERIWEDLYAVYVPDFVTMNRDYIRKFGVPSSGNREVDKMMSTNLMYVRIPIIKILEYYDNGLEIQIPAREDMITIHKNIEKYLTEWKDHIKYDININRVEHKTLLLALEKLSRLIFDKAQPKEVMEQVLTPRQFGLVNVLQRQKEVDKELKKPDYEGISNLLKPATVRGRF